ncbi:hypothetical protein QVM48_16950 [Pseudomonas soli]|uniref:hypothetical protein n=1 Tax=Pseudomonas soli TaxID=1306993 RepID=UPI002895E76E|nr:hypothetical protein [Pseudomonas soli]MDT3716701.1 hypothetical protein [Pseudomonas soli]MDT3733548.1 hypothetical protein [Pseudomonas soli]
MDVEQLRQQVQQQSEIQACLEGPFSRKFLRDRSWIHVRTLDTIAYKWPGNAQSLVELIVNNLITDIERIEIFPSPYDMGSHHQLTPENTRPARVMSYLKSFPENREPKQTLKSISDDIKSWTGYDIKAFREVDSSITAKVLCALYEFRLRVRPTLTSLLKTPRAGDGYSSEFRSTWPFVATGESTNKAWDIVATVADLKAIMTFQMGPEHNELRWVMLLLQLQFESRSFVNPLVLLKGYRGVKHDTICKLKEMLPIVLGTTPARLDVALYVHLTLLEIEHKLYAADALVEFLKADNSIPILQSLELGKEWLYDESEYPASTIFALVFDITGIEVGNEHKEFYWHCSTLVLTMRFQESNAVTMVERFSALVSVLGARVQEIEYPIWWKGYTGVSTRPWHYLRKAVEGLSETGVMGAVDTIPYGYREFWAQRYSLVLHRGMEAYEMWEDSNECASHEIRLVIDMFRAADIDAAINIASSYIREKVDNAAIQAAKILGCYEGPG